MARAVVEKETEQNQGEDTNNPKAHSSGNESRCAGKNGSRAHSIEERFTAGADFKGVLNNRDERTAVGKRHPVGDTQRDDGTVGRKQMAGRRIRPNSVEAGIAVIKVAFRADPDAVQKELIGGIRADLERGLAL